MQITSELEEDADGLREERASVFDDDTVASLIELGETLRRIRRRLVAEEGYVIKDGKLYKPTP